MSNEERSADDAAGANATSTEGSGAPSVPTTTFDLLRKRLGEVGRRLNDAASALNEERAAVFASVPLVLAEQDRVRTTQPSVPRDTVAVNDLLLVGYNAGASLGRNRTIDDTFALFHVVKEAESDWAFTPVPHDDPAWFLGDASFQRDVSELFTYYSDARLDSLTVSGDRLLVVFRVGSADADRRVLRWQLQPSGPTYIDAYGEHHLSGVQPFDFAWTEAGRDVQVDGRWPHLRIDELHLGLTRGQLEIRVDDVVQGGRTILAEPVSETGQAVDELRTRYAVLGDVVALGVQPYREEIERFYLFNRLTRSAQRVDAIGRNLHQLPEAQGVVFPGGYHLQNGENRVFATDAAGFRFQAVHKAPNSEDILYVYVRVETGEYMLCAYNVVRRDMDTPVRLHGYALLPDGLIIGIRATSEPQRVHTVAVYTSPFCSPENYAPPVGGDTFFGRIGNGELVRVLGEALSLGSDATEPLFNQAVFEALVSRATFLLDGHTWLSDPKSHGIGALLVELRRTAGDVLDEFATALANKRNAADQLAHAQRVVADLVASSELELRDASAFIDLLDRTRGGLSGIAALNEVRQIDLAAVSTLRDRLNATYNSLAGKAIEFLDRPDSLKDLADAFEAAQLAGTKAVTAAAIGTVMEGVETTGARVTFLTEVVGGLTASDPTRRTAVLARLADLLARRNAVRAGLDARAVTLRTAESAAGFAASMAVLSQRATASLTSTVDAASCDLAIATLLAELENVELAHGDVEEFAAAIASRRDELVSAFAQRRDTLAAERTKRIDRLVLSAQRGIATASVRAATLKNKGEIDAYFATDALVAKARSTADELRALGEAGRAGELEVALTAARDQARRSAQDREELFDEGTVGIGRWRFGVNTEPFELRLQARDGARAGVDVGGAEGWGSEGFDVRLTGTDLRLPCHDKRLNTYTDLASQSLPSETAAIPRAVFLAFSAQQAGISPEGVAGFAAASVEGGYEPGVHDADAVAIMSATSQFWSSPGLSIDGAVRAVAGVWRAGLERRERDAVERQIVALRAIGPGRARSAFVDEHGSAWTAIAAEAGLQVSPTLVADTLIAHGNNPAITETGGRRATAFTAWATEHGLDLKGATFAQLVRWIADQASAEGAPTGGGTSAGIHLQGRTDSPSNLSSPANDSLGVTAEAAWALLDASVRPVVGVEANVTVEGLLSTHQLITARRLTLDVAAAYTRFLEYTQGGGLDRFRAFTSLRRDVLASERVRLEVDRLRPTVLSSFVRNRLIDEVYFPLVGDNVARQLGMNGAAQGLLLLVSPPGYGKTTLVEYVAGLLGFALVKINGPALGTDVTSLDPAAAPNASAAEELAKLNRAFAMGNNVICYLDDIQHTSAELLQKFIPLCDATRRIEGVIDGKAQTFSLSGKRFVMVMAGNPYTSDGSRFRVPDMLANRADVHNLGDVARSSADAFAQSYLENACGVNEILAPVLGRSRSDLNILIAGSQGRALRSDQLAHPYTASELDSVLKTLRLMGRVRDALGKVNAAYIASATMDDAMRGEPAFALQGSYRNMARIAQRVVPVMTEAEVDALVSEHYRAESQTLATAAGWNLSKLAQVLGTATEAETAEFEALRERWRDSNVSGDPMAVMASALKDIATALARPSIS